MEGESNTAAAFGLSDSAGRIVGGALGGALGAIAFGVVMVLFEPGVVSSAIPAIYGLQPVDPLGWSIHIAHGIVLGVIFGLIVTRDPILGVLRTDVETDVVSRTGIIVRTIAAGFVFGLTVWAILPLLVLPVWVDAVSTGGGETFPATAATSLFGHLLYGTILGIVFAATVDLRAYTSRRPLSEDQ
ncbi:hypothetical protein [Natrinema caseinilyticum]|uniref:hypothetical protein n=1 Tax=Natrinema caseinilyticum TaxID=2961570 RepID=UPI0020C3BDED|nr:hypothetical protein [Natrinema caseinilyticum]